MPTANRIEVIALSLGCALFAATAQPTFADDLRRLTFHNTVEISHCEHFWPAEEFRIGKLIGTRPLGSVGFNFAKLVLAGEEADAHVYALQSWTLRYSDDDVSLIKRLGGEQGLVVPLCAVHHLMEMGEQGGNNTDKSNFAFVRSPADGRLVAVHWFVNHADQWVIGATEVPHPHLDWPAGSRVFGHSRGNREVGQGGPGGQTQAGVDRPALGSDVQ